MKTLDMLFAFDCFQSFSFQTLSSRKTIVTVITHSHDDNIVFRLNFKNHVLDSAIIHYSVTASETFSCFNKIVIVDFFDSVLFFDSVRRHKSERFCVNFQIFLATIEKAQLSTVMAKSSPNTHERPVQSNSGILHLRKSSKFTYSSPNCLVRSDSCVCRGIQPFLWAFPGPSCDYRVFLVVLLNPEWIRLYEAYIVLKMLVLGVIEQSKHPIVLNQTVKYFLNIGEFFEHDGLVFW